MTVSRLLRRSPRTRLVVAAAALAASLGTFAVPQPAQADNPVFFDEAGDAPTIGMIGDSTLTGVRWYEEYGELQRYNYVFAAESCRRTLETSCWSREQYRSQNAITTLQSLEGEWGEVLIMMTGYNDPIGTFEDAVDTIVEEAQDQGIPKVVWLTLRTAEVNYEEPTHLANGSTYDEANRILYDKAEEYGGYLQIADWGTHSAERAEWFELDGVHLTVEGARGVTSYMADTADKVLAGQDVTPQSPPWDTLGEGDFGDTVTESQEALIEAGVDVEGGADGNFGGATAEAVRAFQGDHDLSVTGEIDALTADALGLYDAPDVEQPAVSPEPEPEAATPVATTPAAAASDADAAAAADPSDGGGASLIGNVGKVVLVGVGGLVAAVVVLRRRKLRRDAAIAAAPGHRPGPPPGARQLAPSHNGHNGHAPAANGAHRRPRAVYESAEHRSLVKVHRPTRVMYDYEHEDAALTR